MKNTIRTSLLYMSIFILCSSENIKNKQIIEINNEHKYYTVGHEKGTNFILMITNIL